MVYFLPDIFSFTGVLHCLLRLIVANSSAVNFIKRKWMSFVWRDSTGRVYESHLVNCLSRSGWWGVVGVR